jgi:hypothetical protein
MLDLIGLLVALLLLWLVVHLVTPADGIRLDRPIDISDPRTLGTLIGLSGGTIQDAVVARFALDRFEQLYGRKATLGEAAFVAGMLKTHRP